MPVATATALPSLNSDELLGRCLGKSELARRVLDRFQRQLKEDLDGIAAAVSAADAALVAKLAHRIKGAAANVSAQALQQQAAELEVAARAQAWERIANAVQALCAERDEFDDVWRQLTWSASE